MSRIVPSQVVSAIERTYDWAKQKADGTGGYDGGLGPEHISHISMLLSLLEAIPDELLPLDPNDLLMVEAAKGAMRGAIASWTGAPHSGAAAQLAGSAVFNGKHPVVAVLLALRKCPDERASAATPELAFIPNSSARESLRTDISTAFRAYGNGEYKAATVIAGSAVEALLLWRMKQMQVPDLTTAVSAYDAAPTYGRKLSALAPEKWDLSELIAVAAQAKVIDAASVSSCGLCREFRNLIHPGRVLRDGADASKSTALAALSAMQRLLE